MNQEQDIMVTNKVKFVALLRLNNVRTLKFKDQRTNTFLAAVNQMCQQLLPVSSYCQAHGNQTKSLIISDNIVGSWEEPPDFWLTVAKKRFCWLSFEV